MVAGPLVLIVGVTWLAGLTSPDRPHALADTLRVLATSLPLAGGWLIGAMGVGRLLRSLVAPDSPDALAIQAGLGIAALLVLDAGLGALGILQWGGSAGAWCLLVLAAVPAADQFRRWLSAPTAAAPILPWTAWIAAPAVAVLLVAACSAPGWLWATEFGGYDALSYHLQLPKEWLERGRIEPFSHNVYSYLPGYVEAAYYHLAVLVGDGLRAAYACQVLHAGMTILTAALLGRAAIRLGGAGRLSAAAAATVFLGTPWVIVVGSLGYNEMAVVLLLTTGLLLLAPGAQRTGRTAAAVGLLAAAACGAKLTSAGFVALPLGLLLLAARPLRSWGGAVVVAGSCGLICLIPYLVRNWIYAGNPIFPFAPALLGYGHFTPQQAEIFFAAHTPSGGVLNGLGEAWKQVFRYGLGRNPYPGEPWAPQWSILPWLTAAGVIVGCSSQRMRRAIWPLTLLIGAQLAFWLLATHMKSRFLLPAAVPAVLIVTAGVAAIARRLDRPPAVAALALAGIAWASLPAYVYTREPFSNRAAANIERPPDAPANRIGQAAMLTGEALATGARLELAERSPVVYVNYALAAGSKVLLIGDAAPLYYRRGVVYQTTWDRGPLSQAIDSAGDDPQEWLRQLVSQGFTHLLIEPTMLEIWQRNRWNDPRLTVDLILDFAGHHAELQRSFPSGVRIYRLKRPSAPTAD